MSIDKNLNGVSLSSSQTAPNITDATFTTGVAIQTDNDGIKSATFEISINSERSGLGERYT